ncbi:hypothetical protein B0E53_02907 [Micromonospora sp. MH33]|nr:hypothetical protein B0E53_02907 [Micromonospora sp. MH33]
MVGSSGYASCQDGTAVSASSTPVYVARAGAVTAATRPAACPTGGSSRRPMPSTPRSGSQGAASATAATPAAGPKVVRIQVPIDIGEVSFATRSMWWNRLGRPRSFTRKYALALTAAREVTRPARRRAGRPVSWPPAASSDDPAASPPVNRYAAMSHFHTGALRIGRP